MDFVWRRDAEFLKRTDFWGKFSEQITESAYMDFVIWAKKIPSELSKGQNFGSSFDLGEQMHFTSLFAQMSNSIVGIRVCGK